VHRYRQLIPSGSAMAIVDKVQQIFARPLAHSPRVFVQEHGGIDHMASEYSRLHP
jgi:hypothetical protein